MDFVLFIFVLLMAAFWFVVALLGATLPLLRDWVLSPVLPSARARRDERRACREQEQRDGWERFMSGIQPKYESLRRPYHDARDFREYSRLMRVEVRRLRAAQRERKRASR